MNFHASLPFVAFSVSVTLPSLSHFVSPSNIFSRCFSAFSLDHSNCHKMSSFSLLFLITWPKKKRLLGVAYSIFTSDFVSASRKHVLPCISFDFFAVHEIRSIPRTTFLLPPVSFVTVLKLFRPRIHIHQNGFNIALQGSSSTSSLNRDVVIF